MRKKFFTLILSALLPLVASATDDNALEVKIDGIYYCLEGNTAEVIEAVYADDYVGAVNIPASITYEGGTYSVTGIAEDAFANCTGLTSITIPESVTRIGYNAFYGCSGLTSIIIPYGVTRINNASFAACMNLKSITIPESVTSIGMEAFERCISLTSVSIPKSVTSIDEMAFCECISLTSVTIPNSVTNIGDGAFGGCRSLTSIIIPEGVKYLGYSAFLCCENLTEVTLESDAAVSEDTPLKEIFGTQVKTVFLGNSVTRIGNEAFEEFENLISITISESVTSIGREAFASCINLTSVINGNGVTCIDDYAFFNCSSLASITIPNSVTSIGEQAFFACTSLTSVTIGNGVTSIGHCAFEYCTNLRSLIIGNSVESIGIEAFAACEGLTSVTIPESVTTIDNYAFGSCENLTEVILESDAVVSTDRSKNIPMKSIFGDQVETYILGDAVKSIGKYAFSDCVKLTSVTIGNSVESIGEYAFGGCESLTSVNIPESVTSIGEAAFGGCESLTSIIIPESVISISDYAFNWCSGLTSLTIPNSVTSIGREAFAYCHGLTSVTIGNGVTRIGEEAFEDCENLTSVHFTDLSAWCNIEFEGYSGWYNSHFYLNDEEIKDLVIPDGVTRIGKCAFYNWSNLTSVTIPESVTSIGEDAFYGCEGMTSVNITDLSTWCNIEFGSDKSNPVYYAHYLYMNDEEINNLIIPNGVNNIGKYAFINLSNLTSVTIPECVTSIGESAFYGCDNLISVKVGMETPVEIDYGTFSNRKNATLYVPLGCIERYRQAAYWKDFEKIEKWHPEVDGVFYEFDNDEMVAMVTSPDEGKYEGDIVIPSSVTYKGQSYSVTSIDYNAFEGCENLNSITIGSNIIEEIGYWYFEGCTGLTSIIVEEGNPVYDSREDCNALIETATNTLIMGCKSTVIPDGVTNIRYDAFKDCIGLTSITIPKSISSIDYGAFEGCENLTTVTLESNVIVSASRNEYYDHEIRPMRDIFGEQVQTYILGDVVTAIGDGAFRYCSNLSSVNIPNSVTSIGSGAFQECESLSDVTIPDGVTNIGYEAFSGCSSLTSITIPESVTTIGSSAFSGCENLTTVVLESDPIVSTSRNYSYSMESIFGYQVQTYIIGNAVTSIGDFAFYGCSSLTSVTIPESVTGIGDGAFCGCEGLISVTIPSSVESIGNEAFTNCIGLTSIAIPNSVTSIGSDAFYNCIGLTSVTIPENVTSIGGGAFKCENLTTVTLESNAIVSASRNGYYDIPPMIDIFGYQVETYILGNAVTSIGDGAFAGCYNLTSITIPENVTSIGSSAFGGCSSLTSVTIPISVTAIGEYAFDGTAWFENQRDGLVYAGNVAYRYKQYESEMPEDTKIKLKDGTLGIAGGAFEGCYNLTSITIPESVTNIGGGAFYGCESLTDVYCYGTVPPIASYYYPEYEEYWYAFDIEYIEENTTLHVPAGSLNAYKTTVPWSGFGTIVAIENGPVKKGDLNGDGVVSITDVVMIIDVIADPITYADKKAAADVNSDGAVNITDCVAAIDLIAAQSSSPRSARTKAHVTLSNTDFISANMQDGQLTVSLDNEKRYTAFQMIVNMPEGMTLGRATMDKIRGTDHQIMVRDQGNGQYLVAGFSANNDEFVGNNGSLFSIVTDGQAEGDIFISDIVFATTQAEACYLADITLSSTPTGINEMKNVEMINDKWYDLQGRRVVKPQKGIYIYNGKKTAIK